MSTNLFTARCPSTPNCRESLQEPTDPTHSIQHVLSTDVNQPPNQPHPHFLHCTLTRIKDSATDHDGYDLGFLRGRQIWGEYEQDVQHLQCRLRLALLFLLVWLVLIGPERSKGRVEVPQHSPIRARQLVISRHTRPHTDDLPDLRSLPALDARKDIEEHREPVLRLRSQIPEVLLSLFLFALVFLTLGLILRLRLDDVPQRTQDWWAKRRVGIKLLRKALAQLVSECYDKVWRSRAICGEGGPALICENRPDFCSSWIRFRTTGEVGESVNQGQEGLRKMS